MLLRLGIIGGGSDIADDDIDEDWHDDCPLCRGEICPEFAAIMQEAAATVPVATMTFEEAIAWLDTL